MKRVLATAILSALCSMSYGQQTTNEQSNTTNELTQVELDSSQMAIQSLREFAHVYEQIRLNYVTPLDDETMLENAVRGLLNNLDPHSAYLERDAYSDLQDSSTGGYGGIGVEVLDDGSAIRVITAIDGTPAAKAGIQANDLIVQLNGDPVQAIGVDEAIDALRGEPNSTLQLGIIRGGNEGLIEVEVTREIINIPSVRSEVLSDDIGYIRLSQFQLDSGREVNTALQALLAQGIKGLIIDIRNNPGGVIDAARDIADLFLPPSLIVSTRGQSDRMSNELRGTTDDQSNQIPLVILINEGSASASEILAGALKDHNRAVLVGTRSFGKGSVQSVVPISETAAIKLTTGLFFTPNGTSIQARGIVPDVLIERARIAEMQPRNLWVSEADLSGHLLNAEGLEDINTQIRVNDEKLDEAAELFQSDNQLSVALSVIKGMALSHIRP